MVVFAQRRSHITCTLFTAIATDDNYQTIFLRLHLFDNSLAERYGTESIDLQQWALHIQTGLHCQRSLSTTTIVHQNVNLFVDYATNELKVIML